MFHGFSWLDTIVKMTVSLQKILKTHRKYNLLNHIYAKTETKLIPKLEIMYYQTFSCREHPNV